MYVKVELCWQLGWPRTTAAWQLGWPRTGVAMNTSIGGAAMTASCRRMSRLSWAEQSWVTTKAATLAQRASALIGCYEYCHWLICQSSWPCPLGIWTKTIWARARASVRGTNTQRDLGGCLGLLTIRGSGTLVRLGFVIGWGVVICKRVWVEFFLHDSNIFEPNQSEAGRKLFHGLTSTRLVNVSKFWLRTPIHEEPFEGVSSNHTVPAVGGENVYIVGR